ncbi:hypothetical protein L1765_08370 [Microaerobacter geothermalis]|uniref:5' nucleotidase, NT5C type n=1 Tax=Microaerobacter geothermalis TaxID=674972 RepID=UPI001F1EA4D8|nr:hypothetical protein [Microaerobacter geothermalis]MCF6093983.1 hypothetical protein [Microaerobacter geothermalis]
MKLGVDIDGTIKKTQQAAIQVFNEELGKNLTEEDIDSFYLDEPYGLTQKEGKRLWRKLEHRIYSLGVPIEQAAETLSQLVKDGHEVYFITARPGMKHIREVTVNWLKKHGFPYNGDNLYMNSQDKAKVAQELGIDLFFEDAPDHLDRLIHAKIPTVVVDAVYNREYTDIPRLTHWQDAYGIISDLQD